MFTGFSYTEPILLVCLLLGFAGLIRLGLRQRSFRPGLLTLSLTGILLASWPPADWLFSRPLEGRYQRMVSAADHADAIVVLSGGVEPARRDTPFPLPDTTTIGRCRYGSWLYQHWRPLPIFVSGGTNPVNRIPFASSMKQLLTGEGIPADVVTEETQSRNTHENAEFTAAILKSRGVRRIALVVEANSMLRAELCFRKAGIDVLPAPFRHTRLSISVEDLIPSWAALRRNEITFHELLGLAWYRLRGWI